MVSGCRERGAPFIPSKHSKITKKKDFKDFLKLTLKAKSPKDTLITSGRGILTEPTITENKNKTITEKAKDDTTIENTDLSLESKVKKDKVEDNITIVSETVTNKTSQKNKSLIPKLATKENDTNSTVPQSNTTSPLMKIMKSNLPAIALKEEALKKKAVLFKGIPFLNKIGEAVEDVIPKSKNISKKRLKNNSKKNHKKYGNRESFSGGLPINGLDIGMVRLGQGSTYTRLIFDSYKWEGYAQIPVQKVPDSGTYIFTYEPKYKRITAILDGYQAFSALVGNHDDLYHDNDMVKTIHIDEYLDRSGYKFTIELKQEADVNIFELHNPARIIIDMRGKPIE